MENVSHNTSYSEASPNVHQDDEELMDSEEYDGLQESDVNINNFNQLHYGIDQNEERERPQVQSAQLKSQLMQVQTINKVLSIVSKLQFNKITRLESENAFNKLKLNYLHSELDRLTFQPDQVNHQTNDPPTNLFYDPQHPHSQNVKVLEFKGDYRSDQIRNLLQEDSILQDEDKRQIKEDFNLFEFNSQNTELLLQKFKKFSDEVDIRTHPDIKQQSIFLQKSMMEELKKLSNHYDELEKMRIQLNTKIESVEQMEIENLEQHLILDHRVRNIEDKRRIDMKQSSSEVQTELSYQNIIDKERQIEVKEKEVEIQKFKDREEYDNKERTLLRRERDLLLREKLVDEKRQEYSYKEKDLNQRMKNQISWPLICLDNEQKLNEKMKEVKITPDLFKGLALESDVGFAEFVARDENKKLLKHLQGSDAYSRAENLLKYEYCLIQERTKGQIVRKQIEIEFGLLENERNELQKEREKYQNVMESERQIQDDNRRLEERKQEFKVLVESFKKSFQQMTQSDITFYGTMNGEGLHSKKPSGAYAGLSRIENNINQSVFDSAIHKTSNLISNMFSPQKNYMFRDNQTMSFIQEQSKSEISISQKLEKTLENFDKLGEQYVSKQKNEQIERKEQNLEQIKKIILREAYFIDEEKKWLQEKSQLVGKSQFNTSVIKKKQESGVENTKSLIEIEENESSSSSIVEEKQKLKLMQDNLQLEMQLYTQMNTQLKFEMEKTNQEKQRLINGENEMNEQKLKMLIKFEKIKILEDFYNVIQFIIDNVYLQKHHQDQRMSLEIEVSYKEMKDVIEKLNDKEVKNYNIRKNANERKVILGNALQKMIQFLYLKQRKQSPLNLQSLKSKCCFNIWKCDSAVKKLNEQIKKDICKQLNKEEEIKVSWHDAFWKKKGQQLSIDRFRQLTPDQLYIVRVGIERDLENFWKFKCSNLLKQADLHLRRRARFMLAIAFQRYKTQVYKAKCYWLLMVKDQKLSQPQFIVNSVGDSQDLHFDMQRVEFVNSTEEEKRQSLGKFVDSQNMGGSEQMKLVKRKILENTKSKMDTLESQHSHTYTGISEIIYQQQQNQDFIKKHSILVYLVMKKDVSQCSKVKNIYFNKWKQVNRDIQINGIKGELKIMVGEIENLKFQEGFMRTNFRVQKNELESKINELINFMVVNGNGNNEETEKKNGKVGKKTTQYY